MLRDSPIPGAELLENLALFLTRQNLSEALYMDSLYRRVIDVHGVVVELGVRWGKNLALFHSFRGMYEPFNYTRMIIGFDTFSGFPRVSSEDSADVARGDYAVVSGYEETLQLLLEHHEAESPLSHIRRFELIRGDVSETLPRYLTDHQETVVALAYFDMDLYQPTVDAIRALRPRLVRGSVLAFDEVCNRHFPGETVAVMEELGLPSLRLQRSPLYPGGSFAVLD